eukprot:355678-Chlamydomonas_euryale.AAC.3
MSCPHHVETRPARATTPHGRYFRPAAAETATLAGWRRQGDAARCRIPSVAVETGMVCSLSKPSAWRLKCCNPPPHTGGWRATGLIAYLISVANGGLNIQQIYCALHCLAYYNK